MRLAKAAKVRAYQREGQTCAFTTRPRATSYKLYRVELASRMPRGTSCKLRRALGGRGPHHRVVAVHDVSRPRVLRARVPCSL